MKAFGPPASGSGGASISRAHVSSGGFSAENPKRGLEPTEHVFKEKCKQLPEGEKLPGLDSFGYLHTRGVYTAVKS